MGKADKDRPFTDAELTRALIRAHRGPALKEELDQALAEVKSGQKRGIPLDQLLAEFRRRFPTIPVIDVDQLESRLPATGKSFEELQAIVRKREKRKEKRKVKNNGAQRGAFFVYEKRAVLAALALV